VNSESTSIDVSVVIPICERHEQTISNYHKYKNALKSTGKTFEFIFVLVPDSESIIAQLRPLLSEHQRVSMVILSKNFGEATAIEVGTSTAKGELILILPPYEQVRADCLVSLFRDIDDYDMVVTNRSPRIDSGLNRLQARLFNSTISVLADIEFNDLGCGVRLVRKNVLTELNIYGDQHRFLPVIASGQGFRVKEVDLPQAEADGHSRIYSPGIYIRRFLDLLTIVFLTKFNKKPLRFFGLIGTGAALLGTLGLILVTVQRLLFDINAADRPMLLISALFIVLGIQLVAIGLVGETIIFTHSKEIKEYTIREIIN
jgi:hypothetical protein